MSAQQITNETKTIVNRDRPLFPPLPWWKNRTIFYLKVVLGIVVMFCAVVVVMGVLNK